MSQVESGAYLCGRNAMIVTVDKPTENELRLKFVHRVLAIAKSAQVECNLDSGKECTIGCNIKYLIAACEREILEDRGIVF